MFNKSIAPAILCYLFLSQAAFSADSNFRDIRQLVEYLQTDPMLPVLQEPVYLPDIMMEIYQENNFKPLWDNLNYASGVVDELAGVDQYGLLPRDYHVLLLQSILHSDNRENNPQFDVLLTDGLLLLSHHLLNGKLNPADFAFTWNFPKRKIYEDSIQLFIKNIRRERVLEDLANHHPPFEVYKLLVQEKARWERIGKSVTFQGPLIYTKTIRPGDTAMVYSKIVERLKLIEFMPDNLPSGNKYDSVFLQYIEKFQRMHGIEGDGVIGKQTIYALNIPIDTRKWMINANLERIRWLAAGAGDNMIFVNIAGFHLYVIRDGNILWDTPVMTGAVNTQTPVFTSPLTYIVFNPSWTVPRSILKESLYARIKADPSYLSKNNYYLMDPNGNVADPGSLDWAGMTLADFRYNVVQRPGPWNALGQVKFMFPNKYSIYLHDTPSKSLFSQSSRAFSHGCIRVRNPLELARMLLNDNARFSEQSIREIVKTGETRTVFLKKPITVLLTYFTVDINLYKEVVFREDIYHRDPAIIEKLKAPLRSDLMRLYSLE